MELRNLTSKDLFALVRILNGIGYKNIKAAVDKDAIADGQKRSAAAKADFEKVVASGNEAAIKAAQAVYEEQTSAIAKETGTDTILSVLFAVLESAPNVENDLYKFVGSVAGLTAREVEKMDMDKFMGLVVDIAQMEQFSDFFKQASRFVR